jgi:hypothetical protein
MVQTIRVLQIHVYLAHIAMERAIVCLMLALKMDVGQPIGNVVSVQVFAHLIAAKNVLDQVDPMHVQIHSNAPERDARQEQYVMTAYVRAFVPLIHNVHSPTGAMRRMESACQNAM